MKVLILLPYFNRPNMVRNALSSLEEMTYQNWTVAVIDDGSDVPIFPIAQEFHGLEKRASFYNTGDSLAEKRRLGSRHGEYMNRAIQDHACDLVLTLCDDDAMIDSYLTNLVAYFTENPTVEYAYSHVRIFNPLEELPGNHLPKRDYFTNLTGSIEPSCRVDSSQVAIRKRSHIGFAPRQTANLDADIFARLYAQYGPCPYTGFDGQYKAVFSDQLGVRSDPFCVKDL